MNGENRQTLSWFSAMSGCFRGTEVFQTLIGHSMLRAWWHTLLTVLLLGGITSCMQLTQMRNTIQASAEHFEAEFGGLTLAEDKGLLPADDPGQSHYLLLNKGGLLVYVPAGAKPVLPEKSTFKDYRYSIIWYPSNLVFVMPAGKDDRYAVSTMKFGDFMGARTLCDEAGLQKILQEASLQKWQDPDGLEKDLKIQVSDLIFAVKCVALIGFFGIFFFEAFSQILMCLLIFVGFFTLTAGRSRTLKWGELVRIALYAGCPALAVAACFTALDLTEILSFGTVYVIGTIGYFLVIVNKMEHARHAG